MMPSPKSREIIVAVEAGFGGGIWHPEVF